MRGKREKIKLSKGAYKKAKSFLSFLKPYKGVYTIGFVFLVLSSGVSVLLPYLLGKLLGMDLSTMREAWTFGDLTHVYGVLSIIAVALPAQAIFSFFRIYLFSFVTENTLRDIRNKAFKQLIHFPISFYDANKVGEITSRIATDINLIQETLSTTLAEFIRQFIVVFLGIYLIVYASPQLALTMLLVVPIAAISAVLFGKFIKGLSKETQDEAAKSNNVLEEALLGIKNIKAYTAEIFNYNKYQNSSEKIKTLALKAALWRGLFVGFILLVMFGSIVFIVWRGLELVQLGPENGGINMESFFQFIMMTVLLGASIGSLPDLFAKIQKAIGATEKIMDIIQEEVEEKNSEDLKSSITLAGDIHFNQVSFEYPSRPDIPVLKNITFSIPRGKQIAVVGSSGSGKSTLANLILQFYSCSEGEILFDEHPANSLRKKEIRKQIAYVPQDVLLTSGTILENIAFGNESADLATIQSAAAQANALEFIDKFPEGFNTQVGDRGIQLSGGQKQRIAIARAILKNPKILILDEATSALDNQSEALVQDALEKLMLNRTSIVIAHRLSTIQKADQILVLDNGAIIESGTHQELINLANGKYKKLQELSLV